jgi:hypothetical protein
MGNGCTAPHFLDLGTSWRWVVSFTPRPLYLRERAPGTHWIGGWVDLRAGLGDVENRKFLTLPGLELRSFCRLARSRSLYRLRYPGSYIQIGNFGIVRCLPLHMYVYIWKWLGALKTLNWPGLKRRTYILLILETKLCAVLMTSTK